MKPDFYWNLKPCCLNWPIYSFITRKCSTCRRKHYKTIWVSLIRSSNQASSICVDVVDCAARNGVLDGRVVGQFAALDHRKKGHHHHLKGMFNKLPIHLNKFWHYSLLHIENKRVAISLPSGNGNISSV
jgi:hypothetical protein